ncbi:MAG: hypothetical protein EON58_13775 [Alphaproteobacteria bacterium]|nr:MAG: hypothetical protein EON58_13775 [Alphaproteobacteria bacterium]
MANVDGRWDSVTKSPMGDQKGVLTLKAEGDSLSGFSEGPMGKVEFSGGKIDGNTVSWKMDIKTPMAMTLEVNGTIDGDTIDGTMKMGPFGSFPLKATRL